MSNEQVGSASALDNNPPDKRPIAAPKAKAKGQPAQEVVRDYLKAVAGGLLALGRVQFVNTVDIPALNNRTIWIDVANLSAYKGMDFWLDLRARVVLIENPAVEDWKTVIVPLDNVAAMFPK